MTRARTLRQLALPVALGAAAAYGLRYLVKRANERLGPAQGPIDWARARRVARWISSRDASEVTDRAALEAQYLAHSVRSEAAIAEYLGVRLPAPVEAVRVVDRVAWLEANFDTLAESLKPLESVYGREPTPVEAQLAGVQLGGVFGYLSSRVLGQYDLSLFSSAPEERGVLYFVEPNIARVQRELGLGEGFRLWIALHEVTHVFEFEAYPWVREHFRGLLEAFMAQAAQNLSAQGVGLTQLFRRLVAGASLSRHPLSWLLSPEERTLFERLQALMSLVEGFSDFVMNALGRELLPDFEQIEARVKARQASRPLLTEVLERLIGLDLKRAQYRDGEAFVREVVAARGLPFLLRVWEKPEHLPSLLELRESARWVARLEAA